MGPWTLLTGGDCGNVGFGYTWFHTGLWQETVGIAIHICFCPRRRNLRGSPLMFFMFNDETYVDFLSFSLC